MCSLQTVLASKYGIVPADIHNAAGGFSTKASYYVLGADGIEYFVKVYDGTLPTTRFFVDRIETYMPVLAWLSAQPTLHGRVLTPVPAQNGTYKVESGDDVYAVFLFAHGVSPGIQGMTRSQTEELAYILALLHEAGDRIPFSAPGLEEDISLPFCDNLLELLKDERSITEALRGIALPHTGFLESAVCDALKLRDTIRIGYQPLVLCHGDAHGNNVIQGERLILADWEDLRRAPTEADLFIHAWHTHSKTLLDAYTTARNGYRINHDLLFFYTLRRRIEDVWVDIQRLTEEHPAQDEATKLLDYTRRGIESIRVLYNDRN